MNKLTKMIAFIGISFLSIGLYFILSLFLLSLLIDSELNVYLKVILVGISYFLLVKVLFRALILGTFIGFSPKNLTYPKVYLPLAILFCLTLVFYALKQYSYLFDNDFSFFSLNALIIYFFAMTAYHLLSPLIYFYINSIKPRIKLSSVKIRHGIYEDQEYLLKQNDMFYNSPIDDIMYWELEFEKENETKNERTAK